MYQLINFNKSMCFSELTRKYNDKQKECERLKTDLDTATKLAKKATYNYNSTLAKVIKLELVSKRST